MNAKMGSFLRRGQGGMKLLSCSAPVALAALSCGFAPSTAAAQAAASDGNTDGLEEIIVTAQRREENLQSVPIAVSAVGEGRLNNLGISSSALLPQIVPSVQIARSGPNGMLFIRGVGSINGSGGEEGANAIYVDGVYLGDQSQVAMNFNNIARIEVLKGPQGTLFGRNASGGLIQIITQEPGDEMRVKGQMGYANFEKPSFQLYAGGPLADDLSADFAVTGWDQKDGWGRNRTLNRENGISRFLGARSKIVYRPSNWKFVLSGDYAYSRDNLTVGFKIPAGTTGIGGTQGVEGHDTTANLPSLTTQRIWGVSFTAEADLGFATLTSVSAYRALVNNTGFDADAGPVNLIGIAYRANSSTRQQELRLASNDDGPLSWQVGLFYLNSRQANDQQQFGMAFAALGVTNIAQFARIETNSYAAFGELTYELTPTTKLTGGARFTMDRRSVTGRSVTTLLSGSVAPPRAVDAKLRYNEVTYRAAVRQELTDDISVYASLNRGFKAGNYNLQNPFDAPTKPQYIMAYEVGLKSELFDRRLRFNIAGYHYDISNYQTRSAGGFGTNLLLNAAEVKVDGVDIDFDAAPVKNLQIFGGVSIVNSRFTKFGGAPVATTPQAPVYYLSPATCPADRFGSRDPGLLSSGPRSGGFTTCFGDVSGARTPLAPRFSASIGTTYTLDVGSADKLRASVLYNYNSGYVFDTSVFTRQGSFGIVNGSIEYRINDQYGIELWVNNLTDTSYTVALLSSATGQLSALGAPRTYGANFKFDF